MQTPCRKMVHRWIRDWPVRATFIVMASLNWMLTNQSIDAAVQMPGYCSHAATSPGRSMWDSFSWTHKSATHSQYSAQRTQRCVKTLSTANVNGLCLTSVQLQNSVGGRAVLSCGKYDGYRLTEQGLTVPPNTL